MDMRASLKASYVPPVAPSAAELQASLKGASVRVAPGTPIGVPGAQPLRIVEYPSGRPTQKQDPELTPRGRMRKPLDGGFYVR